MKNEKIREYILKFQKNEITEHIIYKRISKKLKGKNKKTLEKISDDELRHYEQWKEYTGEDVNPDKFVIFKYLVLAKILGLTFVIKMLERNEEEVQDVYKAVIKEFPKAKSILKDEVIHEKLLIDMIEEEKINYIGSMVLGLNDALVELTGALAGLTFALQNTRLVGIAGIITGISASLSMSASEYLSQKSEKADKSPFKASFYTGLAYVLTVLILVFPYFVVLNHYIALSITIFNGIIIILIFTFFVSVVKNIKFNKLFLEMLMISLGVAIASFGIGTLVRKFINVEM